jgi:hypothetical protein
MLKHFCYPEPLLYDTDVLTVSSMIEVEATKHPHQFSRSRPHIGP